MQLLRGLREHAGAMRALRPARETSARAFYGGVLRHRVLRRQAVWIGSRTVLDGAERVRVRDGGALRIGLGPLGLTSEHDTSVVRIRPGAELVCDEVVPADRLSDAVDRAVAELAAPAVVANRAMLTLAEEPRETLRSYLAEFAVVQAERIYSPDVLDRVERRWARP